MVSRDDDDDLRRRRRRRRARGSIQKKEGSCSSKKKLVSRTGSCCCCCGGRRWGDFGGEDWPGGADEVPGRRRRGGRGVVRRSTPRSRRVGEFVGDEVEEEGVVGWSSRGDLEGSVEGEAALFIRVVAAAERGLEARAAFVAEQLEERSALELGFVVAELEGGRAVGIVDAAVVAGREKHVRMAPQNLLAPLEVLVLRLQRRHERLLPSPRQLRAPPAFFLLVCRRRRRAEEERKETSTILRRRRAQKLLRRPRTTDISDVNSLERDGPVRFSLRALLFVLHRGLGARVEHLATARCLSTRRLLVRAEATILAISAWALTVTRRGDGDLR
mmetsp:Transcript_10772/g.32393  ORF Transcript_10772/g.32393 Transcript_10772/m.32393 type:complete len:330 (-) Transcript_10772:65-1054(-)